MIISATTWEKLERSFFGALELPPEERSAYLDRVCKDDDALRLEVEAVLAAHEAAGGATDPAQLLTPTEPTDSLAEGALAGEQIGVYRLEALIGRGGMGDVYRASRVDDQYQQRVAIKVLRTERRAELVRRFLVERQVLARLQHPNIATLLDGGVTERGQPYLVMQYVDGVAITAYADSKKLTLPARLELFQIVCDAVQFAHANLIVHRDLKPSNILVTELGDVRLLDFGIAKLLAPDDVGVTAATTGDLLLLTPQHAAPEQFRGDPITTATDVYALGVLLYQLLAGVRPFQSVPAVELPLAVCEREPAPPSSHDGRIPADLDAVVMMALRKEPARRYASAGQLGEDIARYLDGRPVIARPDTWRYRVSKFVSRNRFGAGAAATAALLLIGATALTSYQSRQRAIALEQARTERAKASRLSDFLLGVFSATNPSEALGRTVTARELLDKAAGRIGSELAQDPLVRADMELAIGRAYFTLGLHQSALPLIESAVALRRANLPAENTDVASAILWLARIRATLGKSTEALTLGQEALDIRARVLGISDTTLASTLTFLARVHLTLDPVDTASIATRQLQRALEILRAANPQDGKALAATLRVMGLASMDQNRGEEALQRYREAIAAARTVVGEDDPYMFNLYEDLALGFQTVGSLDSAIAINQRVLEARIRVFGPDHPDVSYSHFNLARATGRSGRWKDALPHFQRALEIREKTLGPTNYAVGYVLMSYAIATLQAGDLENGVARFDRAVKVLESALGPRNVDTMNALEGLAIGQTMAGRYDAALRTLETAVDRGYSNGPRLQQQPFEKLVGNPRFARLLTRVNTVKKPT